MSAIKTPSIAKNPYFNHVERPSYELGGLLRQLPQEFSSFRQPQAGELQIAEAIAQHAGNAKCTILSGIDAIGKVLFSAGLNDDNPVAGHHLASLGGLISHLATEAQFLTDTEDNLRYALRKHGRDE